MFLIPAGKKETVPQCFDSHNTVCKSGETGGERAACVATSFCCPAQGCGRSGDGNGSAAWHLRRRLQGSTGSGHQDGGDHKEEALRLDTCLSQSWKLEYYFC